MAKLLRPQTRAILLRLNAGKNAIQIAKELSVPVYTVYNTKHRHTSLLKPRKTPTVASGVKTLSQRVFEFIKAYPDLRAHEYGDAFVTLGDKKSSVVGTVTHLVNAGLVERDKATKKLTAVAIAYRPLQQELVSRYKQSAYKPVKKQPAKWATVAVVTSDTSIAAHEKELVFQQTQYGLGSMWGQIPLVAGTVASEPLVVTPMRKRLSLWRRIKAVFTGDYS